MRKREERKREQGRRKEGGGKREEGRGRREEGERKERRKERKKRKGEHGGRQTKVIYPTNKSAQGQSALLSCALWLLELQNLEFYSFQ